MAGPISPDEVAQLAKRVIPERIFESVNQLLAEHWDGKTAIIKSKDIVDVYKRKTAWAEDVEYKDVSFDNKWLNIEEAYRSSGWRVEYVGPAYNETFDSYFTFTRASARVSQVYFPDDK